jgi:hypothetical protein
MWNDDERPPPGHGWLLHGLQSPGQATIEHAELACDEEFVRFLTARLGEEAQAAAARHRPRQGTAVFGGLRILYEILDDLAQGCLPDDVSLDLVLSAYAAHPDFQARWRHPADLLPTTPLTSRSAS